MDRSKIALLIIDVQMAFVQFAQNNVPRSEPDAEANIAKLLEAFRVAGLKVCHIHHHSLEDGSPFTAGLPGAEVQDFVKSMDGEAVYIKHVNSSFIGTSLEQDLRDQGISQLIMCGGTANHCVETTTRMAGNLGFDTYYVADGVWAYGHTGPDGKIHTPEEVHSMSLSNLHGEFATVLKTDDILDQLKLE
ncbi:MAG: isochorismatase family protein [Rhizobiaceae bacterium]